MMRTNGTVMAVIILAAATGLTACASTSDIDNLRKEIQQAQSSADDAASQANQANQTAGEAKATADDAKAKAEATDARIDRMFKKAMYK